MPFPVLDSILVQQLDLTCIKRPDRHNHDLSRLISIRLGAEVKKVTLAGNHYPVRTVGVRAGPCQAESAAVKRKRLPGQICAGMNVDVSKVTDQSGAGISVPLINGCIDNKRFLMQVCLLQYKPFHLMTRCRS